jgi:hypothetical protein
MIHSILKRVDPLDPALQKFKLSERVVNPITRSIKVKHGSYPYHFPITRRRGMRKASVAAQDHHHALARKQTTHQQISTGQKSARW